MESFQQPPVNRTPPKPSFSAARSPEYEPSQTPRISAAGPPTDFPPPISGQNFTPIYSDSPRWPPLTNQPTGQGNRVTARPNAPVGPVYSPPIPVLPSATARNRAPARPHAIDTSISGDATVYPQPVTDSSKPVRSEGLKEEVVALSSPVRIRVVKVLRQSPPWLVSLVVHMVLLIVLALITVPNARLVPLSLELGYTDYAGQQLDVFEAFSLDDVSDRLEKDLAKADLPVEDPLAAPPRLDITSLAPVAVSSERDVPVIGTLLEGRRVGSKEALLAAYGGTATTEQAVRLALEWLKRQQQSDGSWRLDGPYPDGGFDENRVAATAMALLAFQGAGHTHQTGEFAPVVRRGSTALLKMQDQDGNFFYRGPRHHRLYSQAMATIAVCELYGMTKDDKLRGPAERALEYCINIQAPEGGWRYDPKVDSDTSVTGWFAMALQSGRMAGLVVPSFTLDNIAKYLDSAQVDDGSRYAYQPGGGARISMTAEALLCRQYLGWSRNDARLVRGVEEILRNPITWDRPNTYYWYYATQVLHHMGGNYWFEWNKVMREVVPAHQVRSGPQAGSWNPTADAFDRQGGRLYVTCLCTYMLEVYYRHLPIYQH